jgi:nucleotide-binding universal stress UspA family protein
MDIAIRKILFPTDFSDAAAEARQYAMALAERFDAELHFLHVAIPPVVPYPDSATSWTMPDIGMEPQVEEAKRTIQNQVDSWSDRRRAVISVKVGFAVEEIVDYAQEQQIDLIVAGTHGHTGITHLLIGSVAEKLVRIATCPVLTVHPKGHQFLMDSSRETGTAKA